MRSLPMHATAAHSWIRRVFYPTPRTSRKAGARVRPAVECLEDRLLRAGLTLTILADNSTDTSNVTLRDTITLVRAVRGLGSNRTDLAGPPLSSSPKPAGT